MTITEWSALDMRHHVDEAMTVYEIAMGYPTGTGRSRSPYAVSHTSLGGFRAVGAYGEDGRLAGFGYGYASRPGQWWHDQVRVAIGAQQAGMWLFDAFELCELHVLPQQQGRGTGRRLLLDLAGLVEQERMLLSTPEGPTRAWRLYNRLGFQPLARHHRFPGDPRPFAVMGVKLPMNPPPPDTAE